jgi:tRNA 2-(methylsulfanyl)-N6-isopentenyladenosine37 hydroxylase
MLRLTTETPRGWAEEALGAVEELLIDHAHCEKKAASTAVTLIFKYPERLHMLQPLSALAREELAHFELVLDHLARRGLSYRRLTPSPYAGKLIAVVRREEPHRLLDTLLCCALIEARSCERMTLLAEAFVGVDDELARLYRGLLASEARHHATYVDLALESFEEGEVRARLAELARHEGEVLSAPRGPLRMHS